WIWILQDLLGIAFCLNFLKTISLSNFKICVILLSLLLVYDVFFVFITPFLTPNGESIMVQVALGPGAGGKGQALEVPGDNSSSYEKLPVVMRIPQFSALAQNLCMVQFSILGYGDIIIPGLLVAYCHRFDVWMENSRRIYFISCAVAYAVGLVLTFAVMLLSKMGQPALLYLVPCTLLTSAVLACVRKEFRHFWSGSGTYQLPVVMRIPQFSALAQNLCMMQFSILGYGDIIIPGLLVAYCHRFDVWMGNSRRIYFISCAVAYAVGLVLTFAVMLLSKMGQPALLYLVPCTLLTSAVLACVRKEFRLFWSGSRTCQMEMLDTPEQ
ncbi:hypothetical protein cypCar_00046302, partial [Cyprinus carpio]